MNRAHAIIVLSAATCTAGLMAACGPQRVRTPQLPGQDLIVLLPDSESGTVGRVNVSNKSGAVDLTASGASTIVSATQPPAPVTRIGDSEVKDIFAEVLSALPPPPQHFTLYFQFDSDELTDDSRALVPRVREAVKGRPVPEVVVIGHTDTTGTAQNNVDLGLKRAHTVRRILMAAGVDGTFIDVTSHGETDLLVATADETSEAKNRRVEISVR
jgi:outer membrane protein OmpA-like peptidoglycan-associated protein